MERYSVNIYIETSRRGPSRGPGKYMYLMECTKKDGTLHIVKDMESFENTTENELALRAIIAAGKRMAKPCCIRIFTGCNHILSTVHNSWHVEWQKNGWKKKDGKEVRNAELWEELVAVLDPHVVSYTKQGLSEEEVTAAIADFKAKQAANKPDVAAIEKERDEALKRLQQRDNEDLLKSKGVRNEDIDYVVFKIEKLMDDKTDFKKVAEKFLKENPRYAGASNYRVSTSTQQNTGGEGTGSNASINDVIRLKARR